MAKKLTTRQVKSILQGEKTDSLSAASSSKLSSDRSTALNYYLGDMSADFTAPVGGSRVISSDVSDVIDGLMPNLMDIFCGSNEVVRFEPVGPEDIDAAAQETQYVNHVFMQRNPGFNILQAMFKDGLLSKTGIVKVMWEEGEYEEEETYYNQDEDSLMILISKPDFEVIAHTANDDGTHDVTLQRKEGYGCAKVLNVPPEEFGVARRTRRLQDTPYCFHEPGGGRPESELIAEGFDSEQIKKLTTWAEATTRGQEARARDTVNESSTASTGDALTRGMRPVQITEHYIKMDYAGDGKACRYQVITGGDESEVLTKNGKLCIEKIDYVPFAVAHPDPMPHRFFGRSTADKVIETQRIKTALTRGALDNTYLINNQQMEVNEQLASDSTIDDLLNRKIGGIVRTKGAGAVNPIMVQPIADKIFPALEYFDREREWRTGVTREGQGLDASALQNQSATAARQLFSAAQAKMKLIARNLADGVEDLFWLLHCVIRKNGSKPETVRLRNDWVAVDPRLWRERTDMTVSVGLGDGGKQEQLAGLQLLIQAQTQAAQMPLKMVSPRNFYNSAKELVKLLDKHDVSMFFTDPGDGPMPDPPPPPELQKVQMEGQMKQQEMQQKAGIEKLQADADIATNDRKTSAEIGMNRERHMLDIEMKREEHAMRMQEMRMKLVGTAASAASKGQPANGPDGTPSGPDHELIDKIMAASARPPRPKRTHAKRLAPGEWMLEHDGGDAAPPTIQHVKVGE